MNRVAKNKEIQLDDKEFSCLSYFKRAIKSSYVLTEFRDDDCSEHLFCKIVVVPFR